LAAVHHIDTANSDASIDELIWLLPIRHDIAAGEPQEVGLAWKLPYLHPRGVLRLEWKKFVLEHREGHGRELMV